MFSNKLVQKHYFYMVYKFFFFFFWIILIGCSSNIFQNYLEKKQK